MEENEITLKLNNEAAVKILKELLEPFDNMSVEAIPTVLNAFTMALASLAAHGKEETRCPEEDGIERLILKWLCSVEQIGDMHFSKYINLEAVNTSPNK